MSWLGFNCNGGVCMAKICLGAEISQKSLLAIKQQFNWIIVISNCQNPHLQSDSIGEENSCLDSCDVRREKADVLRANIGNNGLTGRSDGRQQRAASRGDRDGAEKGKCDGQKREWRAKGRATRNSENGGRQVTARATAGWGGRGRRSRGTGLGDSEGDVSQQGWQQGR